jgi:hypothetical protein
MAKQIHTYPIDQRPDVEVLVDGAWYPGELRQWIDTDGHRTCDVAWRRVLTETRIDMFPAERVRQTSTPAGASLRAALRLASQHVCCRRPARG